MAGIKKYKFIIQLIAFLAILIGAFFLAQAAKDSTVVRNLVVSYGYGGIFVIALLSGFNLAVPIPAVSFLPLFVASGLSIWPSIAVIACGTALADSLSYLLGSAGRTALAGRQGSLLLRLEALKAKHPSLPLVALFCFAALVPLPNELIVIPLSLLGYRFISVLGIAVLGNFVFNSLAAVGITTIFNWL